MDRFYRCWAGAAFGMEGLVSAELRRLGASGVRAENGGVLFEASPEELFEFNLRMHFCDRLFIVLSDSVCKSFEDLFQAVLGIDWRPFFSGNEAINVSCKCTRSVLMSPRDCQSVAKKAIIESLRRSSGQKVFPESGPALPVLVSVRNDRARIMLNTSGDALSRRGYRTWNGEAPLRETLAAALVELSPWRPGVPLHDPCCGTGTLLIEAAFMASRRAPGLCRSFAMEELPLLSPGVMEDIRHTLRAEVKPEAVCGISGSDLDPFRSFSWKAPAGCSFAIRPTGNVSAIRNPAAFCIGICTPSGTGIRPGVSAPFLPIPLLSAAMGKRHPGKEGSITAGLSAFFIVLTDLRSGKESG